MTWAAIEPECGKYDEAFLDRLAERLKWARENGIWVVLDMHQDLWGEAPPINGDGAPGWATVHDDKPHTVVEGGPWSQAYWTSQRVQTAFDNFWANRPGPDGLGIQERFALAWRHVARRFKDDPAVIGYDLLNEPFIGSSALEALGAVMAATANEPDFQAISNPSEMLTAVAGKPELYEKMLNAAAPVFRKFEIEKLQPMYERVAAAIRKADPNGILFIEPSISSNMGIPGALEALKDPAGNRYANQAYAAHAYDVVTDTENVGQPDARRLELIFSRIAAHARQLEMPLWVGEWGAFYGRADTLNAASLAVGHLERILAGDAYWDFHGRLEEAVYFPLLARPYTPAVAGVLKTCRADLQTRTFHCEWTETAGATGDTRIFLPEGWYAGEYDLELTPPATPARFEPLSQGAKTGWLVVPASGAGGTRSLVVKKRP
jgi:endoglycosylceramidase